jgi:hypothetical protein
MHLDGVEDWEFWWIDGEPGSQQYVVWKISNHVDGLPVTCHGELHWVQLRCFGTDKMDSCVY